MTKKIIALLMLAFVTYKPVMAAEMLNEAQANQLISYYYMQQDPAKVDALLGWLHESQILEQKPNMGFALSAFLSVIFRDNADKVDRWLTLYPYAGRTRTLMMNVLWWSGNRDKISPVFGEIPEQLARLPEDMLSMQGSPQSLDMYWGAFYASGNNSYIDLIIDTLDPDFSPTGMPEADALLRKAAAWSLGGNIMQHELVARAVKSYQPRNAEQQQALQEVLAKYQPLTLEWPEHDGEFAAMLMVLDPESLKEFEKPSSEGLHLKEAADIRRGDSIIIKIAFSGMELTPDLMAHVTYDMKMTEANGKVVESKDLEGLRMRVPMRFNVFNNQQYSQIQFLADDALGDYHFEITVYDRVGGKKVTLKKTITLKE